MILTRLLATRFRNLTDTSLELNPGFNLLYGENGSGKTSLLEAAYFLSSARSFRTVSQNPLIQRGSVDCMVRGEFNHGGQCWQVGVSRNRSGHRDIRINGEICPRTSELAQLLPTLRLGPESVDLLLGPPDTRRRFLNWGLFHVEQTFLGLWEEANRCLRQRNQLLREGEYNKAAFNTWSAQLADRADRIDKIRAAYVDKYRPVFHSIVTQISQLDEVDIGYYRGWQEDSNLPELYEKEEEIDKKKGFTQKGFQRADVRIMVRGQPAAKVCSRGELKALVWSMILAQGALNAKRNMLYLIDDLASEFDVDHRRRMAGYLEQTEGQVFITGLERQALEDCCEDRNASMFHVKHGNIELQSN